MKAREIAKLIGGELVGEGNPEIHSVAALGSAGEGQITFFDESEGEIGNAPCVIVARDAGVTPSDGQTLIRTDNPKLALALVAKKLSPYAPAFGGQHFLQLGKDTDVRTVEIGSFVSIGDGSHIGEGCE